MMVSGSHVHSHETTINLGLKEYMLGLDGMVPGIQPRKTDLCKLKEFINKKHPSKPDPNNTYGDTHGKKRPYTCSEAC